MDTPRDIAKRHRPGRPMEDELEDDIARHVIALEARIAKLEAALREIAANTYGTELCNSDAKNNEILGRHLVRFQKIAREALAK